jgi:hypothetical protein
LKKLEIFQFKVTLKYSHPPIWRRFLVLDDTSFNYLHYILQKVMGWDDYHAYEFIVKGESIMNPEGAKPSPFHGKLTSTTEVFLYQRLKRVGHKFEYIYDFGDNWEHEIVFEKRFPFDENQPLPFCLEGEMACPPEDCGGIGGFFQKLELVSTPPGDDEDPDKDSYWLREWMGDYDPRHFDINEVNLRLQPRKYNGEFDDAIARRRLEFVYESLHLETFFHQTDIDDNAENRKKLLELIFSSGKFVLDKEKDKIYPNNYLLEQFKTRIQPTPMEIDKGILFPGHRLIPFFDGNNNIKHLKLLYHYKPMDMKEVTFKWKEVEVFFSLLNVQVIPLQNPGDIMNPDRDISLHVWDLGEFYQRTHFKPGDSILLQPEDIRNRSFSIKYVSAAKMKKQQQKIQQADRLFIENLRKVLKMDIPLVSISHQLLYVFYGIFQVEPNAREVPGSAFSELINKTGDIVVSSPAEGIKLLHFRESGNGA